MIGKIRSFKSEYLIGLMILIENYQIPSIHFSHILIKIKLPNSNTNFKLSGNYMIELDN